MTQVTEAARLPLVDSKERGARLQRLIEGRLVLNLSQAEAAIKADVGAFSRDTLRKMYAGEEVRPAIWNKVETWVEDQLALRAAEGASVGAAGDALEVTKRTDRHVAFRVKGNFGVEFAVEGDLDNAAELQKLALDMAVKFSREIGESSEQSATGDPD